MSTNYPALFSPLDLAGVTLRNRIALTATLTNYGRNHQVTDRWSNFLVERARGGAAMIVSEVIAVDPQALANPSVVTGFDDSNAPAFEATARSIREAGAHLVGQLWHPGRQQLWHPTSAPMGVSDQPDAYSWTVPHVMSTAEVRRIVDAYVSTATRLAECGFTGVELHGAHGYLITQFLSPWSNTRRDDYGGSSQNRARFALEIARGIRQRCGGDFVIGLKMPATEGVDGGIDVEEASRITRHLRSHGPFDYFAYGQGNFSLSLEDHVPDMHYQEGHFIELHKRLRVEADGVPVMALGKVGHPRLAERIVAEGFGDLVGMSRALIADAAFPAKAGSGRAQDIRQSTFNNFCWGEVHAGKPLAEMHNPHLGEAGEADWTPIPAPRARRIVVVGTGIAGLEAAWVAAARGHRVTLVGRSTRLGGKARLESSLPGHGDSARVHEHQLRMIERHGVDLVLDRSLGWRDIAEMRPDALVLATGATMREPDGMAVDTSEDAKMLQSLHQFAQSLAHESEHEALHPSGPRDETAVVFDHDQSAPTYAAAEALAERYRRIVLVTPRTQIAQGVNYCSALGIHRRLYQADIEIVVAHRPVRLAQRHLTIENVFSGRRRDIDSIARLVYSTPRRSLDPRGDAVFDQIFADVEIVPIGDCVSPRNALIAVHEGHAAGNAL